jgi:hypothetical protein
VTEHQQIVVLQFVRYVVLQTGVKLVLVNFTDQLSRHQVSFGHGVVMLVVLLVTEHQQLVVHQFVNYVLQQTGAK